MIPAACGFPLLSARNRIDGTDKMAFRFGPTAYKEEKGRAGVRGNSDGTADDARGTLPLPAGRQKGQPGQLRDQQKIIDWIGDVVKIVAAVLVILYCVSISEQAYEIGYSIFYEEAIDAEGEGTEFEVTITEEMSVTQIGNMLEAYGLIQDSSVFPYQELFSSSHGKITAGTYILSTEMTPSEIISTLAENYEEPADETEQ